MIDRNNSEITCKQLNLFILVITFSLASCKDNTAKRDEVATIVNEWTGKEILFPERTPCYVSGLETVPEICDDYFHKEFKILLYVDSAGCSSCRLKLFEWKQLMDEAAGLYPEKVGFLLYFQPKDVKDIDFIFVRDRLEHLVFMDTGGEINRLNQFPQAQLFQCFLLDSENKVLSIGNPTMNPKIWDLFKSHIEGKRITETKMLTAIKAEKVTHDYGTIRKGSSNSADFKITNAGNNPLVISRISVACGCTRATYDKQPIAPGQTTTIRIEMTPDETGSFTKTAVVWCNIGDSPLRLTVSGLTVE